MPDIPDPSRQGEANFAQSPREDYGEKGLSDLSGPGLDKRGQLAPNPVLRRPLASANPLVQGQFRIPFDQIKAADVEAAVRELRSDAQAKLDAIINLTGPRTFENTMLAFDMCTDRLEYARRVIKLVQATTPGPEFS